jgi:hypothetical protein
MKKDKTLLKKHAQDFINKNPAAIDKITPRGHQAID